MASEPQVLTPSGWVPVSQAPAQYRPAPKETVVTPQPSGGGGTVFAPPLPGKSISQIYGTPAGTPVQVAGQGPVQAGTVTPQPAQTVTQQMASPAGSVAPRTYPEQFTTARPMAPYSSGAVLRAGPPSQPPTLASYLIAPAVRMARNVGIGVEGKTATLTLPSLGQVGPALQYGKPITVTSEITPSGSNVAKAGAVGALGTAGFVLAKAGTTAAQASGYPPLVIAGTAVDIGVTYLGATLLAKGAVDVARSPTYRNIETAGAAVAGGAATLGAAKAFGIPEQLGQVRQMSTKEGRAQLIEQQTIAELSRQPSVVRTETYPGVKRGDVEVFTGRQVEFKDISPGVAEKAASGVQMGKVGGPQYRIPSTAEQPLYQRSSDFLGQMKTSPVTGRTEISIVEIGPSRADIIGSVQTVKGPSGTVLSATEFRGAILSPAGKPTIVSSGVTGITQTGAPAAPYVFSPGRGLYVALPQATSYSAVAGTVKGGPGFLGVARTDTGTIEKAVSYRPEPVTRPSPAFKPFTGPSTQEAGIVPYGETPGGQVQLGKAAMVQTGKVTAIPVQAMGTRTAPAQAMVELPQRTVLPFAQGQRRAETKTATIQLQRGIIGPVGPIERIASGTLARPFTETKPTISQPVKPVEKISPQPQQVISPTISQTFTPQFQESPSIPPFSPAFVSTATPPSIPTSALLPAPPGLPGAQTGTRVFSVGKGPAPRYSPTIIGVLSGKTATGGEAKKILKRGTFGIETRYPTKDIEKAAKSTGVGGGMIKTEGKVAKGFRLGGLFGGK